MGIVVTGRERGGIFVDELLSGLNMTDHRHLCKCYLLILLCIGCGSGQPVRVLPVGVTTVSASLGGPIVPSSSPIGFVPYLIAGATHGVTDDVSIHGNLHVLMMAFAVGGLDLGASVRLLHQDAAIPEITASVRLIGFMKLGSPIAPRLYPDVSINTSWEVTKGVLLYTGAHGTAQWKPGAFFISPFLGIQLPLSRSLSLQSEFIWQAANHDTRSGVFEGQSSIGGMGSVGGFIAGVLTL